MGRRGNVREAREGIRIIISGIVLFDHPLFPRFYKLTVINASNVLRDSYSCLLQNRKDGRNRGTTFYSAKGKRTACFDSGRYRKDIYHLVHPIAIDGSS